MRLAILADIHANLSALNSVLDDINNYSIDGLIILGDVVNYGMRPNEVIEKLRTISFPILANIWGNHEKALIDNDLSKFSTGRGRDILKITQKQLTSSSFSYINQMSQSSVQLNIEGKNILLIHGNLDDIYWGKLDYSNMNDERYYNYDFVISGHSHIPHYVEVLSKSENPFYRNKKKTTFINPGSVGQPRNHIPLAQYSILDISTNEYLHRCVNYDIIYEQSLYNGEIDSFYKERLTLGI